MLKPNDINILDWYKAMGVDEVHSNKARGYGKAELSSPRSTPSSPRRRGSINDNEICLKLDSRLRGNDSVVGNDSVGENDSVRAMVAKCKTVPELKQIVLEFDGCELKKTATNTVFADGNSEADIMFIGEAPGANEDLHGIPFCGDSGKLLDNVIKSIGLDRGCVYITNTIFWRPPGNRRPSDEELAMCLPFVEKHIALVNPKLIVLVGGTASMALFGDLGPITSQRQKQYQYTNEYLETPIPAVVIFHPSYLLRQPTQKKQAWYDMLYIRKLLGDRNE